RVRGHPTAPVHAARRVRRAARVTADPTRQTRPGGPARARGPDSGGGTATPHAPSGDPVRVVRRGARPRRGRRRRRFLRPRRTFSAGHPARQQGAFGAGDRTPVADPVRPPHGRLARRGARRDVRRTDSAAAAVTGTDPGAPVPRTATTVAALPIGRSRPDPRSEEHTSELQSREN